jgi:hypothetical protein
MEQWKVVQLGTAKKGTGMRMVIPVPSVLIVGYQVIPT